MTPKAQRIAIAEACGWMRTTRLGKDVLYDPSGGHVLIADAHNHLPDYPNDLNAMHEAEKVLTPEQRIQYVAKLAEAAFWDGAFLRDFGIVHATAAQRAEAFCKTLNLGTDK